MFKFNKKLLFVAASGLALYLSGCDTQNNLKNSTSEAIAAYEQATGGDTADVSKESEGDKRTKPNISGLWQNNSESDKLAEISAYVDSLFYFDVDEDYQDEAFYDGIMNGLNDPYSVYYTKEEYEELMEDSSGEYVGIGAVVTQAEDKTVSVVRPIPGSPAEEAGLLADDVFVEIDGVKIVDQELTQVVDMIRGVEGTTAHLKMYRKSVGNYMEFDVKRRVVENLTVETKDIEDNIGYIQVSQFYENTADEFKAAIDKYEEQGAKGLIIDMRDNPGGLLTAVVDMCDYMLDGGDIVTTKDKNGEELSKYTATSDHSVSIPVVLLVNGNSASASEIFAGAMQDTDTAILVGTQTFGKGIVQSVIPLSDGTAIKITVAKYFTPEGNDIHGEGITPDYVVELKDGRTNAVSLEFEDDLQLQKALELLHEKIGE